MWGGGCCSVTASLKRLGIGLRRDFEHAPNISSRFDRALDSLAGHRLFDLVAECELGLPFRAAPFKSELKRAGSAG